MDRPLISICIPTYNRANFLKECLDSITSQFSNPEIKKNINVFVLDNQSKDDTEQVAKVFTDSFDNVTYIKDDENRDIVRGIVKAASLADGEYIWIFSDDDLQTNDSFSTIIEFINKHRSDLVLCNLSGFSDTSTTKYYNLMNISEDTILDNKKELFKILNKKFNINIDYYTTLCSNWIIKRDIFYKNYFIFDKYKGKLDMFPLPSLFFYTNTEFNTGLIAKQVVLNRGDNSSWGYKNEIKHFFYRNKLWRDYYQKIIINNRDILPKYFIIKVWIKNIFRFKDLLKIFLMKILKKR